MDDEETYSPPDFSGRGLITRYTITVRHFGVQGTHCSDIDTNNNVQNVTYAKIQCNTTIFTKCNVLDNLMLYNSINSLK